MTGQMKETGMKEQQQKEVIKMPKVEIIKKTDSNIIAIKKFFGLRPGQTLPQFSTEFKQLALDEQKELADAIRTQVGV